ncbi:MAG: M20/M25/M40 family metallo-hydrolase [Candidatus Gastranaerophilales bacterium]|nr:M20/M25/M40 family metallo-hydrolase [Candidatus Gastranaerophilales bacterium]
MYKNIFVIIFIILLLFTFATIGRTIFQKTNKTVSNDFSHNNLNFDNSLALKHIQEAIQIKTVTDKNYEKDKFENHKKFLEFLKKTYVNTFEKMSLELVDDYGIVLSLKSDSTQENLPVLITGHYDTVGVSESDLKDWVYNPFSGKISDGKIWGRGTLDDKCSVIAIFEALEMLIKNNYLPKQDVYVALGYDEEIGGERGAKNIAKYFAQKQLKFSMILDEGGRVETINDEEIAYIGISEKGRLAANIKIKSQGGHASRPPQSTSVTMLADVIIALNKNQMKAKLIPQSENYFVQTFNNYDFLTKYLIANRNIFKPILLKRLSKDKLSNAYIRTTTAMTMLKGSGTVNVIPEYSQVTVDMRILPTQTTKEAQAHLVSILNKIIGEKNYEIEIVSMEEPSKISKIDDDVFLKLKKEINVTFPKAKIVPYMIPAGTDARQYQELSDNVYRFLPIKIKPEEYSLMHGINEYLTVENYTNMISFYYNLLKNL